MPGIGKTLLSISYKLQDVIFSELKYSQTVYTTQLEELIRDGDDWLDLGCGHQVLPDWSLSKEQNLVARCNSVWGIDLDLDSMKRHGTIKLLIQADSSSLPFKDNSFDIVTSNMVLEHVGNPPKYFAEVCRVLRPGGQFLLHTPNKYGYNTLAARILPEFTKPALSRILHDREPEDIYPALYLCNSSREISDCAAKSGLQVGELRFILSTPQFRIFPPLALFELLYLRLLSRRAFKEMRPNIMTVMQKPGKKTEFI